MCSVGHDRQLALLTFETHSGNQINEITEEID